MSLKVLRTHSLENMLNLPLSIMALGWDVSKEFNVSVAADIACIALAESLVP